MPYGGKVLLGRGPRVSLTLSIARRLISVPGGSSRWKQTCKVELSSSGLSHNRPLAMVSPSGSMMDSDEDDDAGMTSGYLHESQTFGFISSNFHLLKTLPCDLRFRPTGRARPTRTICSATTSCAPNHSSKSIYFNSTVLCQSDFAAMGYPAATHLAMFASGLHFPPPRPGWTHVATRMIVANVVIKLPDKFSPGHWSVPSLP